MPGTTLAAEQYLRASSLARKFVSDFPAEEAMPLELPPEQAAVFDAHVRPLLDLAEAAVPYVPAEDQLAALAGLAALLGEQPGAYTAIRGAADYVQCTFAQCVVDTAASWTLDADRAAYLAALRTGNPAAADEALLLELRRRLVQAGAGDLTAPLAVSLRKAKAPPAAAASGGPAVMPFREVASSARGEGFELAAGGVAWPSLRRSLAAASGRYLEPVLGEVAEGGARIVVSGAALSVALLGAKHPPALATGEATARQRLLVPGGADAGAPARWFDLSIVGPASVADAAQGVEGYARELLGRHKMRHVDAPLASASGQPLRPLLVLTQRSLLALLPEAVHGPGGVAVLAVREVGLRLRLQSYRDPEELLLGGGPPRLDAPDGHAESDRARDAQDVRLAREPAPAPADAWGEGTAFDGDDAWVLPAAARALATGRALVDPARLRGEAAALLSAMDTSGIAGGERAAGREREAAVALVRALALRGWEPEVPLPTPAASDADALEAGGVVAELVRESLHSASEEAEGSGHEEALPVWERPGATAERAAAALVAAADGIALSPDALRAALIAEPGGGEGEAEGAARGPAAMWRARQLRDALRNGHGWLWAEVDEAAPGSQLPREIAEALPTRLRMPLTPAPAEPFVPPAGAAGVSWFYGRLSA